MVLSVAANYGGRWDITMQLNNCCTKVAEAGEISVDDINEDVFRISTPVYTE